MNLTAVFFALLQVLTFTGTGSAQHMNAKDAPCKAAESGAETTRCLVAEAERADRELNLVYNLIRTVLSPEDQGSLQKTQRLWIQFRDSNCAAERDLYGVGTGGPPAYYACVEAVTRQRAAELKVIYGWRLEKAGSHFP